EGNNVIHNGSCISYSFIGKGTYIGENSSLVNCEIGKFCSIGSNVKVISATHPSKIFVSTHPAFYSTKKQAGFTYVNTQLFKEHLELENGITVKIGNDVWI